LTLDYGCFKHSDTIDVNFFPKPIFKYTITPKKGTNLDTIQFISLSEDVDNLFWEIIDKQVFYDSAFVYRFEEDGRYEIYYNVVDKYGCVRSDYSYIDIRTPFDLTYSKIFVPNSFTPNSDNINDLFMPSGAIIESYEMLIYNRWGELIYSEKDKAWDGTGVQSGSFRYVLVIKTKVGGKVEKNGLVYLVR